MIEIRLQKSKWKALKYSALTLVFIVVTSCAIYSSFQKTSYALWFGLLFWGICFTLSLYYFFNRKPILILSEEGIVSNPKGLVKWIWIENIELNTFRPSWKGLSLSKQYFISVTLNKKGQSQLKQNSKSPKYDISLNFSEPFNELHLKELLKLIPKVNSSERQHLLLSIKI